MKLHFREGYLCKSAVTRQWLREVPGALGIGLILYAVFVFDMTTPFPGEAALLPCLGAALIILTGREGRRSKQSVYSSLF